MWQSILMMFGKWALDAIISEVKEYWEDGEIRAIAKESVIWAKSEFSHDDKKAEESAKKIKHEAEILGKKMALKTARELAEKAYQRWLKN